ncbi:MAG: glutathione S-transferase N-terminal domain-containing protein [Acetobacteraceae bacterium]
MRLFHAASSPFARKVVACAIARGIEEQITLVPTSTGMPVLAEYNPLGKLPCLVTNDGVALFDSRVICEFLDTVGDVYPMFPLHSARIRALRFQALGDGIADALVLRRAEEARPQETARVAHIAHQTAKVTRSLAFLEQDLPALHLDIGTIAVACSLGYLDLRFASEPWRETHPKLAAWYAEMLQSPCLARTIPG